MKLFVLLLATTFCLTACGDDRPQTQSTTGQGSNPTDSTTQRVNQGAVGTDLGNDSTRNTGSQDSVR